MKVPDLSPKDLASAQNVIKRVEKLSEEVAKFDNTDKVDLDSTPGKVVVSREEMIAGGKKDGIVVPIEGSIYKDEVQGAKVSKDGASGKIDKADLTTKQYYDSSYGRSAETDIHYKKEEIAEKDGFLGLTGEKKLRTVYTQDEVGYYEGDLSKQVVKVDKETGEIVGYKVRKGKTFAQSLKKMLTSPSAYFLTAVAAVLTGAPGTLTGVLFGPIAGVVGAGLAIGGLAYADYRMSKS